MSNRYLETPILVVDDLAMMRDMLKSVLRGLDHMNFIEATDGDAALRCFQRSPRPRIAFLDIQMPGRCGLEVLREIKQRHPQTFVVMVSAAGTLENVQTAIEQGADAFVVKPYKGIKIQQVLETFYQRHPNRRPAQA